MMEGRVAYYGSTSMVMSYLSSVGYELPKVTNAQGIWLISWVEIIAI